jgi:hypothetical protein
MTFSAGRCEPLDWAWCWMNVLRVVAAMGLAK